jgi:uncharacterized membrane protein
MKTSSNRNYGIIIGRIMMALVLAIMIGSMDVSPAFAKNNKGGHDKGGHYKGGHDNGRKYHHGKGGYYHNPAYWPYGYSYGYRGSVYASPPVIYAPPPVIYAPPPPPGISIFFPPIIIYP